MAVQAVSANHFIMKKLLEVFIDDQGNLDLACDKEAVISKIANLEKNDETFKKLLATLIKHYWGDKEIWLSSVIRELAIADACASAQPYESVEEYWSMMMFGFIQRHEKYADSLKRQYGLKTTKVSKPLIGINNTLLSETGLPGFTVFGSKGKN